MANVTLGKPAIGGAVHVAPAGTTLPSDATTALADGYVALGYISDSGLTNSNSPASNAIKAWGGDTVLRYVDEVDDTFKFNLIEALNIDVLKTVYGDDNVTGTLADGATITVKDFEREAMVWVIDLVLNGAVKRIVVPLASITAMSDITYSDTSAVGYEITITAQNDASGNKHYEYIKNS